MRFYPQHSFMDTNNTPSSVPAPVDTVMRDADAVDAIQSRMAAQVDCRIQTPFVGRLLRREYNWMARKLFLRGRSDDAFRKRALRLIDEIAAEVTLLEADVEHLDRWSDRPLSGGDVTLRVVDLTAARLLAQWRRLDTVAAILYRAQIYGLAITAEQRWDYLRPVTRANSRLTNHCLGATDADRVAQSAAALRLGD